MFNNSQEAKDFFLQNSGNIPNLSKVDEEDLLNLSMQDVDLASMIMEKGLRLGKWEETPLLHAIMSRDLDLASYIIKKGINLDLANIYGRTALMFAAQNGYIEIVNALIDGNADVNAANQFSETALMFAAEHGHTEAVNALVYEGVDINAKNSKGDTALHLATMNNKIDAMELLIASAASLNLANNEGRLPGAVVPGNTWERFLRSGGKKLIEASEYCDALLSENPPALNYNLDPKDVTSILINKLARSGNLDEFFKKYENRGDISFLFTGKMKDTFKNNVVELREKVVKNSFPQKIYDSLVANGDFQDVSSFPTLPQKTQKEIVRRIEGLCRRNSGFSADAVPDFLKPGIAQVVIKNIEDTHNLEQDLRRFLDKKLEFGYMDFKDLLNEEYFDDLKNTKILENPGGYQVSFSDFLSTNAYNEDQFKNKSELDRITYAAKEEKIGEYLSNPNLLSKITMSNNIELVEFLDNFLRNADKLILPKGFKDKLPKLKEIINWKMIDVQERKAEEQEEGEVTYVTFKDNGLVKEVQGKVEVLRQVAKEETAAKMLEIQKKAKEVISVALPHVTESQSTTVAHTHNKDKTLENKGGDIRK